MIDLLQLVADARSLRPNTKRGYANVVRQWLAFAGPYPKDWTAAAGQAFYDHLIKTVTHGSANMMITGGLSFVLKRAAAHYPNSGISDITAAIDRYRVVDDPDAVTKRHALTPAQAKKLLAACGDGPLSGVIELRDRAVVVLGLYTGMRRMSLVSVDLRHVSDHGTYVVLQVRIKGGAAYNVPLDTRAWALTSSYRRALAKLRPADGPLFPAIHQLQLTVDAPLGVRTVSPQAMTEDGLYRALVARAKGAGLKFSPHLFRHTFSTWCRAAKVPDHLIEVVTGHKGQRGMVDRFYTDRDQLAADVALQCYEAITARLAGGGA